MGPEKNAKRMYYRGQFCAAVWCNNFRNCCTDLSLFRFPSDESRCKEWVKFCLRDEYMRCSALWLNKSVRLCSDHFEPSMMRESGGRRYLRPNAMPTLYERKLNIKTDQTPSDKDTCIDSNICEHNYSQCLPQQKHDNLKIELTSNCATQERCTTNKLIAVKTEPDIRNHNNKMEADSCVTSTYVKMSTSKLLSSENKSTSVDSVSAYLLHDSNIGQLSKVQLERSSRNAGRTFTKKVVSRSLLAVNHGSLAQKTSNHDKTGKGTVPNITAVPVEDEKSVLDVVEDPEILDEVEIITIGGDVDTTTAHLESLCRICACQSNDLIDIFQKLGILQNIGEKINKYLPIKVASTDVLPLKVCISCLSTLNACHDLVRCCIEADKKLKMLCLGIFDVKGAVDHKKQHTEQSNGQDFDFCNDTSSDNYFVELEDFEEAGEPIDSKSDVNHMNEEVVKSSKEAAPKLISVQELETCCLKESETKEREVEKNTAKDQSMLADGASPTENNKVIYVGHKRKEPILDLSNTMEECGIVRDSLCAPDQNTNTDLLKSAVKIESVGSCSEKFKPLIPSGNAFKIKTQNKNFKIIPVKCAWFKAPVKISPVTVRLQSVLKKHALKKSPVTVRLQSVLKKHALKKSPVTVRLQSVLKKHALKKSPITLRLTSVLKKHALKEPPEVKHTSELKEFACSKCKKRFTSEEKLESHVESHNATFLCDFCGRKIVGATHFYNHKYNCHINHTKIRPFECGECGKRFTKEKTLVSHHKNQHEQKSYDCKVCNITFPNYHSLVTHKFCHTRNELNAAGDFSGLVISEGQKKVQCNVCDKHFACKSSLREHIRIHEGLKPYICDVCGLSFRASSHLNMHYRIHSGNKPFACDFCGKKFMRRAYRDSHRRYHTGEKPYVCNVCGKDFTLLECLKQHKKIHSETFAFPCSFCLKKFRRREHLQVHSRKHSTEFSCATCGKFFRTEQMLTRHKGKHTRDKSCVCEYCGDVYTSKKHMKKHMTTHS